MQIQLLRHATLILTINNRRILVDPMLSRKHEMDAVGNASVVERIPMTELPISDDELTVLIAQLDGVLVTHLHRDHWDARAVELLPKTLSILCPPECVEKIEQAGFQQVQAIESNVQWLGLRVHRTDGQHGTGEIGKLMGKVSGFVIETEGAPKLYIAGDTIWCAEVEAALSQHQPQVVVVNAGAAQFLTGDPITMTADDVRSVCETVPNVPVIAVHMDTVNHCLLKRDMLRDYVSQHGLSQVIIPDDSDVIAF
jgi:L-ascorbate metabolism protein UlaG (beta-lactamase superfamily)